MIAVLLSVVAFGATCPNPDAAAGAAAAIATIGADAAAPKAATWVDAAACFDQLGLPHVAAGAWVQAMQADPTLAREGLDALAATASRTGNDVTLVGAAATLPESARSPAVAAFLGVASARDLAAGSDRLGAIDKLGKVPAGSWVYFDAQYRLGRLQWERGKKDEAKAAFTTVMTTELVVADPFVAAQVRRWRDLSALAVANLAVDAGDLEGAEALLDPLGGGPLGGSIAWSKAWLAGGSGSKVRSAAAAMSEREPPQFLPDLPLLIAGAWVDDGDRDEAIAALGAFDTRWGPVRDGLDAFLELWQSKPADAWTAWRAAPSDPTLARDVMLSARVASFTRDFGLMATEQTKAASLADPAARAFALGELSKARATAQPKAGRALVNALQSRQERLYTLTSQAHRLRDETLPGGSTDPEALRAVEKPLSFLSTDWGL